MDLNSFSYTIYIITTYLIIIRVGWICYRNGEHFIYDQLPDKHWVRPLNNLLLTGYYLFNLGFTTATIFYWPEIHSTGHMFLFLLSRTGEILFILGMMHYLNIFLISKIKFLYHKNYQSWKL